MATPSLQIGKPLPEDAGVGEEITGQGV
jgi:hypothetical protein